MGMHTPDELLPMYSRGEITPEQATGHILQNMVRMEKLLNAALKEIERLKAFVGMETERKEDEEIE